MYSISNTFNSWILVYNDDRQDDTALAMVLTAIAYILISHHHTFCYFLFLSWAIGSNVVTVKAGSFTGVSFISRITVVVIV